MKRVLIVDDEADVLWVLQKNLNKGMPDVEILVAASGEEALRVLHSHAIDLVIADINMPGMNGLDLLVEINNKYSHIGVVIITAYPSNTYQSQAILSGSLKFIEKPFDIKYLRKIVEKFFNNDQSGFQGTISGIDLFDIVRFNSLSRATAALKVTTGESAGMIFFKDGQVVHAILDQMRGEEAFFTILGFHGGNLKNIKGVETPLVTIFKSLELLLLQATSSADEVMLEEEETPFLTYEELEKESPPDFLSQRKVDEPPPSLDEESPGLLSDGAWLETMTGDNLPAGTLSGMVPEEEAIPGLDVDDDVRHRRAYLAKTSSILSAEFRAQRATSISDKASAASISVSPPERTGARADRRQSPVVSNRADDDFLDDLTRDIPGLDVGGEEPGEPFPADFLTDAPIFLSDTVLARPPTEPPAEPPAPTLLKKTAVTPPSPAAVVQPAPQSTAKDNLFAGAGKAAESAEALSPFDAILAEFTAIDGVRLACLAGRDGFLIASQPAGDNAQAEALTAIASSRLVLAESMGEELLQSGLQIGLFEYQDGTIILSPLGQDSFLMLLAEDGANLGWLRLVIRKNAGRLEELNAQ